MRPKHIRPEVWLFKIAELKLMLEGKSGENRGKILYGWKVEKPTHKAIKKDKKKFLSYQVL